MKTTSQKNYIDHLKTFLEQKSDLQKLVVIYGPTAAGKTEMSIDIAKHLDSEIISTDSRQIFKYMDIGTGKITPEETQGVKHHMLDIIDPDEKYSVGEFKKASEVIMSELYTDNKIPILCGGTGLYIDSLIYDFNIPEIPADPELRADLEAQAEKFGNEHVFHQLVDADPDYDRGLHPNNVRYVIRALEVKLLTGKSKTSFKQEKKLKYDVLFLTPEGPADMYSQVYRDWLYDRINRRVKIMFESGLLEENKMLLKKGHKKTDFGMKSIGYQEVQEYLDGNISLEDAIAQVQQNSRNYAKRQLTWFRKYN
ncbi:tRNA (adenosine(37)-N6)-dimethylallyltransferase MiaA [Candidatus Gracilibacteria bacterium]|nr:tRNA (adenosine(37)-N6)-dimethylallyltransferase MiaA [Candidatus Gracilibacteria bacterium]